MIEFILYVADQQRSKVFYRTVLAKEPELDVPGMTEFLLAENVKLGLMPEAGIAKILSDTTPLPAAGNGIPRCELYLYTDDIEKWNRRLHLAGAKEVSAIAERSWGDKVCYFADLDGHIIAIAEKM